MASRGSGRCKGPGSGQEPLCSGADSLAGGRGGRAVGDVSGEGGGARWPGAAWPQERTVSRSRCSWHISWDPQAAAYALAPLFPRWAVGSSLHPNAVSTPDGGAGSPVHRCCVSSGWAWSPCALEWLGTRCGRSPGLGGRAGAGGRLFEGSPVSCWAGAELASVGRVWGSPAHSSQGRRTRVPATAGARPYGDFLQTRKMPAFQDTLPPFVGTSL